MENKDVNQELSEIKKQLESQEEKLKEIFLLFARVDIAIHEAERVKGTKFKFETGSICVFGVDIANGIVSRASNDGVHCVKKNIQNS